jgi:hypothetical protein
MSDTPRHSHVPAQVVICTFLGSARQKILRCVIELADPTRTKRFEKGGWRRERQYEGETMIDDGGRDNDIERVDVL